jgi:hypothetical protein
MINIGKFVFVWSLFFGYAQVFSQDNPIALPSSPAFSIMDYEPASVMRPGNPKDLSTDILNSFDKDGKLLMNLGLEVAPYWLKSRPFLDRKKYLEAKGIQSLLQTLLISAATVKDTASGGNKFGAGVRFKLYNGHVSKEYEGAEKELIQKQLVSSAISAAKAFIDSTSTRDSLILFIKDVLSSTETDSVTVAEFMNIANERKMHFDDSEKDQRVFIDTLSNVFSRTYDDVKIEVATLARQRYGFILEFAGATSFTSTDNSFDKGGIWFTASNVVSQSDSYNLSFRYYFSGGDTSRTNADLGISYVKQANRFSISVEGMARVFRAELPTLDNNNEPLTKVDDDFTYRLAVQTAYRIAGDISINISIGKDFDDPFISGGGFFSIFGVSYSFFKPFER